MRVNVPVCDVITGFSIITGFPFAQDIQDPFFFLGFVYLERECKRARENGGGTGRARGREKPKQTSH